MRGIFFLKKNFLRKCSSSEKADAVQKYLVRKKSSSVDISILSNSSAKKVVFPKSNYPKEHPIVKKWPLRKVSLRKSRNSEKITATRK